MLVKKVLENEAFNASKKKEDTKDHKKTAVKTKRDKKARCYICKERGHAYWDCGNRKKLAGIELQQVTNTKEGVAAEGALYPEKVHIIADYMVEGSNDKTWDQVWYVSCFYKFHMCPRSDLFQELQYKFKMIGKEENEKKFILSYGIRDARVNTKNGDMVISKIQYTPEVSINILSYDLLEEQGYTVQINNNMCSIKYMYDEGTSGTKMESNNDLIWGPKEVIKEHDRFMEDYFASIDPNTECSLVKGLEELTWNRDDTQDYIDEEYISWNGNLYALKVNSFNRFMSFMNLIKKDELVFKNWAVVSKKFLEVIKWFYLVYLNYEMLEALPAMIGVIRIDLLCLHKMVASLGGYVAATLGNKWGMIAQMQGLTQEDGQAIKDCFRKFIDLMVVYHETARVPWGEKPMEVGESNKSAEAKDLHGQKEVAVMDGTQGETMNNLGVKVKIEEEEQHESSEDNNDFDVIV
ncbi:bulb-type lectin domain-containing protein [Artemisia annua]|uniref:Bulb-type lectin domain-containing protein n=1 Tax=Artemisia annua TaxID=35608 RepID=A0A2U1KTX6_ARTAN|nr:bulb-type lectin domain-containing protein [Artemisia annua]